MRLSDATLKLYDSEFVNNGVVLSHSQLADDNCSSISVVVYNCSFVDDVDSRPVYRPGVALAGCRQVRFVATDSTFRTAPVLVVADVNGHVRLERVRLIGSSLRGGSLDVTVGRGDNSVTMKDCDVGGHEASRSSAVSIGADAASPRSCDVQLRRVRFHDNRRLRTSGAALSMFARFARARLNASLYDCTFVENSAATQQTAGALYIANVDSVRLFRCRFERNAATDGGAVHVYSSSGA